MYPNPLLKQSYRFAMPLGFALVPQQPLLKAIPEWGILAELKTGRTENRRLTQVGDHRKLAQGSPAPPHSDALPCRKQIASAPGAGLLDHDNDRRRP